MNIFSKEFIKVGSKYEMMKAKLFGIKGVWQDSESQGSSVTAYFYNDKWWVTKIREKK